VRKLLIVIPISLFLLVSAAYIYNAGFPGKLFGVQRLTAEPENPAPDLAVNEGKLKETSTTPEEIIKAPASISLTGEKESNGIKLTWDIANFEASQGFKVIKSSESNPSFPGDTAVYLSSPDSRSYLWDITDGKVWHFRVCEFAGSGCGVYSQDVSVQAPLKVVEEKKVEVKEEESDGEVDSIKLTVTKKSDEKVKLTWTVDGRSEKGFKIIWSKNDHPTYPLGDGDKFHYLSDPSAREDIITDFDGGHKYYFRVCEYLGGKCGVYSNEVSVDM